MVSPDIAPAPLASALLHLQVHDSAFPTGSYAHSFGLEGAVALGIVRDAATLRAFLDHTVAPALRAVDLPAFRHARPLAERADVLALSSWDQRVAAAYATRELRAASASVGRNRLLSLLNIRPLPWLEDLLARAAPHAPVAAAVQSAALHLSEDAARAGLVYQAFAGPIVAAPKLFRIGPNEAQRILHSALADWASNDRAFDAARPVGTFNPFLDIASARHEHADLRLFVS